MSATQISTRVIEELHYITLPKALNAEDLKFLESKIAEWSAMKVEMHILDMGNLDNADPRFYEFVKNLSKKAAPRRVVSVHMRDGMFREVSRLKLESSFNRVANFPEDLKPKKSFSENDKRKLLIRYLIRGAYAAVEVALNSTVSCDENYLAKPEKVPFHEFDLISRIDVQNEFMQAQFRLCASSEVLRRLATAMLGTKTAIDEEVVESMAAELLNLIYGQAKSHLNDREGFGLPSAIPTLMRKEDFARIKRPTSAHNLSILPLVTPMGSFYVEVEFPRSA